MRARLLACLTVAAVAAGVALDASHGTPPPNGHVQRAPYTTSEILEYLLLSSGRVVADHHALERPVIGSAHPLAPDRARAAVQTVVRCVDRVDAAAGPTLTAAFNAADPQRLDLALHRFDSAANRWLTAPYEQNKPCPPPPPPPKVKPSDPNTVWLEQTGWLHVDYLVESYVTVAGDFTLWDAGAIVIGAFTTLALIVLLALVVVPTYDFVRAPSDLDRQTGIAKIVQALRS